VAIGGHSGQRGLAGIGPGRQPVRADVSCGIRELADQRASGLIVKAIEVLIVVRLDFETGVAIGYLDDFQPTVRAQASLEGVVGGSLMKEPSLGAWGKTRRSDRLTWFQTAR